LKIYISVLYNSTGDNSASSEVNSQRIVYPKAYGLLIIGAFSAVAVFGLLLLMIFKCNSSNFVNRWNFLIAQFLAMFIVMPYRNFNENG
jgi:hypothetical protein